MTCKFCKLVLFINPRVLALMNKGNKTDEANPKSSNFRAGGTLEDLLDQCCVSQKRTQVQIREMVYLKPSYES